MGRAMCRYCLLALCLVMVGCTYDGGAVADVDLNKTVTCTDVRDGDVFTFNTNSITNVRAGIGAPSSFDVVTDDGRAMTLSNSMAAWVRCEKERP